MEWPLIISEERESTMVQVVQWIIALKKDFRMKMPSGWKINRHFKRCNGRYSLWRMYSTRNNKRMVQKIFLSIIILLLQATGCENVGIYCHHLYPWINFLDLIFSLFFYIFLISYWPFNEGQGHLSHYFLVLSSCLTL